MTPWTEYTSIVALGVGANSENLPVGLAYAMRRCRIDLPPNLAIAALTTIATLIPLAAGHGLRGYMPAWLPDIAAGLLLVLLGLTNLWLERRRGPTSAPQTPQLETTRIGLRETLALAGALSLNNIGLGLAGGIAGLSPGLVAASVGGFSFALLWLGQYLGRNFARRAEMSRWLSLDGNILIVIVGLLMALGA
jgi:putative Mn2+ efflux pump MntP